MNVITAIVNIITAPVTVIIKALVVTAVLSFFPLSTPSNLLIGRLALSDVLVALTYQPGYITYRLIENKHRVVSCFVRITCSTALYVSFGVSFMTFTAVSYERLVAVCLPVRYNFYFTLLSIAGKVLARLLLKMLVPSIAQEHLAESQWGFRANRSTKDMAFALRQLQEKCREQNMGFYATFANLTKAFDTVSRKGL